jgi:hypothetical protein
MYLCRMSFTLMHSSYVLIALHVAHVEDFLALAVPRLTLWTCYAADDHRPAPSSKRARTPCPRSVPSRSLRRAQHRYSLLAICLTTPSSLNAMVGLVEIQKSNAKFASQNHAGMVCVFAGATAGIGLATLTEMVDMVKSSTFYVLGRNAARYQDKIEALRKRGPTNRILLVETQVALISKIDEACAMIGAAERKVDLVCVSPGGMPFQGATCTFHHKPEPATPLSHSPV